MEIIKDKLYKLGWIKKSEKVLFKRLIFNKYNYVNSPAINEKNLKFRNDFLNDILSNDIEPRKLSCCIENESDDILVSEIDRYGLPIRTVLNKKCGLMRTDPYYTKEYLTKFYTECYRDLYSTEQVTYSGFLSDQMNTGENIFNFVKKYLPEKSEICEIGCGMGGILLPFKLNGFDITGIDLGDEYIQIGKGLNLNLINGEINVLIDEGKKFDLVIINHVLEHIPEVKDFLIQVKKILSENGFIYIAVPGINSIPESYDFDLLMFLQNAHCWHFTRNTLSVLLNQVGFEVIEIEDEIKCISRINSDVKSTIDIKGECDSILDNLKLYDIQFQLIQNKNDVQLHGNLKKSFLFKFSRKIIRMLIYLFNKSFKSKYYLQ